MSLIVLNLLALVLAWPVVRNAWRVWSIMPRRNADFDLVGGDTGGRP